LIKALLKIKKRTLNFKIRSGKRRSALFLGKTEIGQVI
jgi:hypothetical protein